MAELPTGTVTFLFADIEGSTTLAQQYPAELPALLPRHRAIVQQAIQAHDGHDRGDKEVGRPRERRRYAGSA